ncbi:MAG: YggS family pyridoxal phosphate enzyme [Bacteroidales bacterium]|nr:YggS family pyridoxal phosphate enzyme [Bacteroidales bacterium]
MIGANLKSILERLPQGVRLVAVSKFHPASAVREAYEAGQRIFGESRPQELEAKAAVLPSDIEWHFIGHLQTNKLKKVLPYVTMVESIDSFHLLEAVSRWGLDHSRPIDILLELHLGAEQTKQGFTEDEILEIVRAQSVSVPPTVAVAPQPTSANVPASFADALQPTSAGEPPAASFPGVRIRGLMGMATNTPDESVVKADFERIAALWRRIRSEHPALRDTFTELSIGMSADWPLAVASGSTLVRIGTAIFGSRSY